MARINCSERIIYHTYQRLFKSSSRWTSRRENISTAELKYPIPTTTIRQGKVHIIQHFIHMACKSIVDEIMQSYTLDTELQNMPKKPKGTFKINQCLLYYYVKLCIPKYHWGLICCVTFTPYHVWAFGGNKKETNYVEAIPWENLRKLLNFMSLVVEFSSKQNQVIGSLLLYYIL